MLYFIENIRVLPVLMVVVVLSMMVRVGDVAETVWATAEASSASAGQAGPGDHENDPPPEEDTGEVPAGAPDEGAAVPAAFEEESRRGETVEQWQDATDSDIQLSKVRMDLFRDLSARRKSLDRKAAELARREALLQAAEQELDNKYQELTTLRDDIAGLLRQQSEEEQKRIASLVKVYEGMKSKDAARIFDSLDIDILVAVMSRMSERKLSPILAEMKPDRARHITILLAEQKKLPELPGQQARDP